MHPIRIRYFRGKDEPATREEYSVKFEQVLKYYGVTKVTSVNRDWYDNENTWLVIAEDYNTKEILGGARLQGWHKNIPLPIEAAVSFKDPSVHSLVNGMAGERITEFCGLWNSRKLAGYRIGSMYLGIACIAILPKLEINKLIGLCAPSTKINSFRLGFEIEDRLGENGEFNYPKENLVATTVIIKDTLNLPSADDKVKQLIMQLRNPQENSIIKDSVKKDLDLVFEL